MKLMLDTNVLYYLIKQQPASVLKRFLEFQIGDIGISSITLAELRYGVAKSRHREKNAKALDEFIIPLEVSCSMKRRLMFTETFEQLWKKQAHPSVPWICLLQLMLYL